MPENQFFLTSKAGVPADGLGPLRNYLSVTGWAVMAYLFKCLLKTTVFTTFELSFSVMILKLRMDSATCVMFGGKY